MSLPSSAGSGVERASVRVLARVRPLTTKELQRNASPQQALTVQGNEIIVLPSSSISAPIAAQQRGANAAGAPRTFRYDMCFCSVEGMEQRGSQDDVYAHLGPPLVDCAQRGINGCLLAYGQTGSGKTHTVMGAGNRGGGGGRAVTTTSSTVVPVVGDDNDESDGVLPRLLRSLFSTTQREAASSTEGRTVSYRISARYFEIYNEKVFDLLQAKTPEIVIKSVKTGILSGAREELITSADAALQLLQEGDRRRTVAATLKNERSSRSHAIFQLISHKDVCTVQDIGGGSPANDGNDAPPVSVMLSTVSCVSLVDLAGSERQKQSGAEGQQFREMVNINLSLSTLRRVIQVLHDNAVRASSSNPSAGSGVITQAPIRESVLTSILSPCFGGNSRTTMIINVSPAAGDVADTVSTLEFGSVARRVVNEVSVNEDKHQALLRDMSEEIARLRSKLDNRRASVRMSRRMSGILRQHAEDLRLEALQCKRSVGVSTVLCGPAAQAVLNVIPIDVEAADVDSDEGEDDVVALELYRNIAETTKRFESMQSEVSEHVHLCRRLQDQLSSKDLLIAALRRQVVDVEKDFKEKLLQLGSSPHAAYIDDATAAADGDSDALVGLRRELHKESRAHDAVVHQLNQNQEAVYLEGEQLRRAYLGVVQQLAEMRNEMNVLEDKGMVAAMQSKRIIELEEQVAHHMEERVALLMENHRLRLEGGTTNDGEYGGAASDAPGTDRRGSEGGVVLRDRCASTSGI